MSYEVLVTAEAKDDLRELIERDRAAATVAIRLALELRQDPYLGKEMRDRPGVGRLSDCRSIAFDAAGRRGKKRYRLVYRNEPHDGAPHIVAVIAFGSREKLEVYRKAVPRRTKRLREQG